MNVALSRILMALMGIIAVALPIWASVYLAAQHSRITETNKLQALAEEALKRVEAARDEVGAAFSYMQNDGKSADCSEESIRRMRKLVLRSVSLHGIGVLKGNIIVCSSYGEDLGTIVLGEPDVKIQNTSIWRSIVFRQLGGAAYTAIENNGYIVFFQSNVMDIFTYDSEVSIGLYGTQSRELIYSPRGSFNPSWVSALEESKTHSFYDGQALVVGQHSTKYKIATYAALPAYRIHPLTSKLLWIVMPLGVLCGLALAGLGWYVSRRRLSLKVLLRNAIRTKEIYLLYQPVVRLPNRRCVGAEALIRWRRPDGTHVQPDAFIPVAEETGLIHQLTTFVINTVAKDSARISSLNPDVHIGLNLSRCSSR